MSPENAMQDHYYRMNDAREADMKEARLTALRDAHKACEAQYNFSGPVEHEEGVGDCRDAIQRLIDEASK